MSPDSRSPGRIAIPVEEGPAQTGAEARAERIRQKLPEKGTLLLGKYRVEDFLGAGAMGAVVSAHHEHLEERVALKILLPAHARDADLRSRFKREAQNAFKLKSEHVCHVLDAGDLEDGAPFFAMEFLEGKTLAAVLRERGTLPIHEAVDYVMQACMGLAEAHANDIVHRDLKPANFVLTTRRDGSTCLKVIDFGISKIMSREEVTDTFGYLGSPTYSAPEQFVSAREATARTDQWGLGVLLYMMVAGRHPFTFPTNSFPVIATTISRKPPEPLRASNPDVPRALESIVMRCLEKKPADRFASVLDLAEALAPFGSGDFDTFSRSRKQSSLLSKLDTDWRASDTMPLREHSSNRIVDPDSESVRSTTIRETSSPLLDAPQDPTRMFDATRSGALSAPRLLPPPPRRHEGTPSRVPALVAVALAALLLVGGAVVFVKQRSASGSTPLASSRPAADLGAAGSPSSATTPIPSAALAANPVVMALPSSATHEPAATASTVGSAAPARSATAARPQPVHHPSPPAAAPSASGPKILKDWQGSY